MIYLHDKKHLFVNVQTPPNGVPEVITSINELNKLMQSPTVDDYSRVFYYTGPTTGQYKQYSYYVIKPEVTVTTRLTCAPFEVYDCDGIQPIGDAPLAALPNDEAENKTRGIIECTNGYLYLKMTEDVDKTFESIEIQNGVMSLTSDESDHKIIKVETDGEMQVLTNGTVEIVDGPPFIVTIDAHDINFGRFYVYDVVDPMYASDSNKVGTFCGADGYTKVAVISKTGYLYFKLDESDAGVWSVANVTSGDMKLVKTNKNSHLFKVDADSKITIFATNKYQREMLALDATIDTQMINTKIYCTEFSIIYETTKVIKSVVAATNNVDNIYYKKVSDCTYKIGGTAYGDYVGQVVTVGIYVTTE